MIIKTARPRWALNRRTVLKGFGTAMALPFLDAMSWGARAQNAPPVRFFGFYVPCGIHMAGWTPSTEGANYTLTPILQPLASLKSDFMVLSNLDNYAGTAQGDGPGDHARGTGTFLTCVHPNKSESVISVGPSVDQVIAQTIGSQTRFASLQLGIEGGNNAGGCDSGYSCAYTRNVSWAGPSTPVSKETNARAAFDRLFEGVDPGESAEVVARRLAYKRSVIDFVKADVDRLNAKLGTRDKQKLDEYLTGIRDIEGRLEGPAAAVCEPPDRPEGNGDVETHARLMLDITAAAFACDLTRVATFMLANGGSNRNFGFLADRTPGLNANVQAAMRNGHHSASHHQGNADSQRALQEIDTWEVSMFAHFLNRLKDIEEGEGQNVLHNSLSFFSSEIEDGNSHAHVRLPVLLAGHGGGAVGAGRHVRFESGTPIANLFLTIMQVMGAPQATFGDDGDGTINLT